MTAGSTARPSWTCIWPWASFAPIENRVPLARAVNTGLSALVDGNGEIRESLAKESKGVLSVTVPLDRRTSYYSRWGDWLGLTCLAISIGLVPMAWALDEVQGARPEQLMQYPQSHVPVAFHRDERRVDLVQTTDCMPREADCRLASVRRLSVKRHFENGWVRR